MASAHFAQVRSPVFASTNAAFLVSGPGPRLGMIVKRPRIYGSEANCRRALARYIGSADALIDESLGLRKRVMAEDLLAEFIILGWDSPRRWQATARSGLSKYLQDQLGEVLPVLCEGVPRQQRRVLAPGEQPRLKREQDEVLGELDGYVDWVTAARDELKELQAAVGVRRGIVSSPITVGRFEELLASGLVDRQVIEDHARDMRAPRTPKQLANAIGAAKELTEATLRAAIDHAGASWKPRDDLGVLMRTWRQAMLKKAAPDPEGEEALSRVQAGLGSLITFLAEWRNPYGDGHGRTRYPPGLRDRHARLAIDAAETAIRFIVTTMDDLQLLPP